MTKLFGMARAVVGGLFGFSVPKECSKLFGMIAPKVNQLRENPERFGTEMMLNDLNLLLHRFRAYPKKLQHLRQDSMSDFDMVCHLPTFLSEGEATIFFVIHKAALGEAAHHVGNG